jgi:hypothetical protein
LGDAVSRSSRPGERAYFNASLPAVKSL